PDAGGETLRLTVESPSLNVTGYAAAWAMTHFMAKTKEKEFFAYLRTMSARTPFADRELTALTGAKPDNLKQFRDQFGEDLGKLEAGMIKHLKRLPYVDPVINQTYYVLKLYVRTGGGGKILTVMTTSPARIGPLRQQMLLQSGGNPAQARFLVKAYPNRNAAMIGASRN
ncbi:MAG: DUF1570 domain-containing protein, partial [Planctomycetales bacterium]